MIRIAALRSPIMSAVAITQPARRCCRQRVQSSKLATLAEAGTASNASTSATSSAASKASSSSSSGIPVRATVGAMVAGVAVVSLSAYLVEDITAPSVPEYDPKGQRYDQATFVGRFSRMLLACDPRLLLYTHDQVLEAKRFLDNHHRMDPAARTKRADKYKTLDGEVNIDRALWEARRLVEAAIHSDTGEFIPRPFRMSGFVPFNGPICVAMVASPTTSALLFWSWVNQSQNALVNYYNRNASSPMTNQTLAVSYGAAVGSALLVAFGLATAIQRRYSPQRAKELLKWVAFPSAVVASSLNCFIVRSPEIRTGVPLVNENGDDVLPGQTSQEAAARGVYSTTASRSLLQAPVYFVPPLLLQAPHVQRFLAKNPTMTVPTTTFFLLVCFGIGLPASVAVFPQMAQIEAKDCEAPYQHLRNARGEPYHVYYYNKGL